MSGRVVTKKKTGKSAGTGARRTGETPARKSTSSPRQSAKKEAPSAKKTAAKNAVAARATRHVAAPPARKASPAKVAMPATLAPRTEERYAGLTEADLKRAPSAQYMSPQQVAFFRERLRAMQRELLEKAGVTSEHLREHDIESDPTDQATIEEEYALELRARDRERKLLKKIEQALRRIEDGSYGYCEETGDAIGIARLLARPTATLSVEAQSRRELRQKLYGD